MKGFTVGLGFSLAVLLGVFGGCRKEPTSEESVARLKAEFAEKQQGTDSAPSAAVDAVRLAIAAATSDQPADGVIALQKAKAAPGLSASQLAAMEQTSQSLIADLTRRADGGDAKAKAQLQAIERSRSQ